MCELQENLTCAICVDHFRDPVKLPCQHTYCRECIRTHAEKSKPKETYDTSELSTIPKKEWLIYCPLCRKEASLGKDGVDDLPNNIYLCGMADRSRSLETVEEGACAETPENTVDQDLCMTHESALIMYCETCPKLICLECLEEHERHLISSTKAAYRNLKEPIQKKAEECEVFKDELACLVSETESLLKEIRENENTHRTEIESAYNEGLDVLNTWRRDALNRIENRHLPLTNKTERVLAELPVKMAEIEKMIQEALDLPTSLTGTFLQMSRDLTSRMDVHLSNAPDFLKDQRKVKKTVAETLKLDPAAPLNLDVKLNVRPMKGMGRRGLSQQLGSDLGTKRRAYSLECDVCRIETGPQIELPWLKFIKTSHKSLGIEAYGTMVCAQEGPAEWCEAWTDGCLQTGCNFWRLQVHLKPSSCERQTPRCIFTAGVRHKGSSLNGKAGVESWWVGISKYEDKSQVNSECGMVKERFRKWIPFQELYTLGFRLWCETGRLTIVDCEQNSVILTIDNVDVSKPLVPSVDFHGDLIQSASVSLVTGNSMALPSVLLSTV